MKTINFIRVALMVALLGLSYGAQSQTIVTITTKDRVLKDTVIKDIKYPMYVGGKGGKYIIRMSKTGSMYKQYIKAKKKD